MAVFRLTMFPAEDGDCLLLTYGEADRLRHIFIDGGRRSAYRHIRPHLADIAGRGEPLELLVLTHIDADHIEGILAMAEDPEVPLVPRRVWYNGFDQMDRLQAFGERQGDAFSDALAQLGWPLNAGFDEGIVSVEQRRSPFEVAGLQITLLSPDHARLARMRARWANWRTEEAARQAARELERFPRGLQRMGRKPMPTILDVEQLAKPTPTDPEPPNGSSIAFVAEWQGKRVLLAGDAHPDALAQTLAPLAQAEGGKYRVDLLKVSHHGSHGNTTRELLELLDSRRFAISTNGSRHGHPDPQAIARLLAFSSAGKKTMYFNYDTLRTRPWGARSLQDAHGYTCIFPASAVEPTVIDI